MQIIFLFNKPMEKENLEKSYFIFLALQFSSESVSMARNM